MSCSNCKAPTSLVWSYLRICFKIFVHSIVNLLETLLIEEERRFTFEAKVFAEGTAPVTLWLETLCVKSLPLGLAEIRSMPTCFRLQN